MKVALFRIPYLNDAEWLVGQQNVNDFIIDKKVIDMKMTESGAENGWNLSIMVIYEDNKI